MGGVCGIEEDNDVWSLASICGRGSGVRHRDLAGQTENGVFCRVLAGSGRKEAHRHVWYDMYSLMQAGKTKARKHDIEQMVKLEGNRLQRSK